MSKRGIIRGIYFYGGHMSPVQSHRKKKGVADVQMDKFICPGRYTG